MLRETPLHGLHRELGAKLAPFAGYEMPLWYASVRAEHGATREGAGLFDVAHMGVFEARGAGAAHFLDAVTTNDVKRLRVGDSHYTFLLDVDGQPIDDLMIYRLDDERYLLVVNAANNDKDWAWLNAAAAGEVMIDRRYPARRVEGADRMQLRDLRARTAGADQRVDIALQGPRSQDILLRLGGGEADLRKLRRLPWAGVTHVKLGGFDLIVSRTGYTGERVAYELFPHPDAAESLFRALLDLGATACGLAARDSLRTEAGLPLYGFELAGDLGMNPADAGFAAYVKLYKPFFVGKAAFIRHEAGRDMQLCRFRIDNRRARPARNGDALLNARGTVIGTVTSCNIDSDGGQTGLALVKRDSRKVGARLWLHGGDKSDPSQLTISGRVKLPEAVTVVSRFPKRK